MTVKRWTFLVACVALGGPLYHGLLLSFWWPGPVEVPLFLAFVLIALGYLVAGLASVRVGIMQAWKGRWSAVLACSIVPAAIAVLIAVPGAYLTIAGLADYVHLAVFGIRYERAVDAATRADGPRYLLFHWNDLAGMLGPDTQVSLAYDESDEFALPDWERSDAWKVRAERAFENETGFREAPSMPASAHHLVGHYSVFRVDY